MNTIHHAAEQTQLKAVSPRDSSIGQILIAEGRITTADALRILKVQHDEGMRFGEAARKLGLLTDADIEFALARQFDYPYLAKGSSKVSAEVVAAYNPFSPQVEALRAIRSQLMLRWFQNGASHKALAVISASEKEGRSWVAANLAVVFSQLGARTLLVDADLRQPRQHQLFGVDNRIGLSALLTDRAGLDAALRIPDLRDLSLLPAGTLPPNPQEILARPGFARTLERIEALYDVILFDTPCGSRYADGQTVAVRAGGALMVTRRHVTRVGLVRAYGDMVRQAGGALVGSVLNER
ncbi:MAG: chain length determinant protein tyrosine kinase EpsG [Rhodocyclaceae bacterium]|nr:chain length determinant protein tyrosine kinase EpsG [Rhodocyclaceae bacterium]